MAARSEDKAYKAPAKNLSKTAVACAVFIGTIILTLLSFVSMELAMLTFGVMMLVSVLYFENRARGLWELTAAFKFKALRETQKNQGDEIARTSSDIEALKQDMKFTKAQLRNLKTAVHEPDAPEAPPVSKSEPPPRALMEFLEMEKTSQRRTPPSQPRPPAPRAIRPGQMMDDEPFFEEAEAPREEEYEALSDTVIRELVTHAVEHSRVDVFVQPIMRLPQRQTRFYEIFARIRARPGQYLPAARYMPIAEQDNLQNDIDTMLLTQCLKTIESSAHVQRAAPFFINITSSTLKNTAFMKRLLGFLAKNRDLAPRLVFEMAQKDFADMPPALLEIIRGLGKLGCAFSLDHVTYFEFDIADLQRFKIRFVKIDARALTGNSNTEHGMHDVQKAKRVLEANSIGVIIAKIEDENILRSMLDFDIHYGQGYLFGKPELQGAYANRARIRRTEAQG
jgi:EAL domain-containing protein (putative c-di-GMP-specific phosphodiesterase class I)